MLDGLNNEYGLEVGCVIARLKMEKSPFTLSIPSEVSCTFDLSVSHVDFAERLLKIMKSE